MATINQLRRIINNGYVKKARQMLKSQVKGMSDDEIFNAMSLSKIDVNPFSYNSKHRVNSWIHAKNPGTCNVSRENCTDTFNDAVVRLFGEVDTAYDTGDTIKNFVVKKDGKNIGIFSLDIIDDTIRIGNFGIEQEYRGSRVVLDALLAIRDSIVEFAKTSGIPKIITEVNDGNKQLLSLYQRFGFNPVAEINFHSPFMRIDSVQHLLEVTV